MNSMILSTIIKALLLCPFARADYCVNGFCYPDATSLLQVGQHVTAGGARGGNVQQPMMGGMPQPMMGGMPRNPMMGGMPNPMMGGMPMPGMPNPMMGGMPPMPGMPNPMMGGMPSGPMPGFAPPQFHQVPPQSLLQKPSPAVRTAPGNTPAMSANSVANHPMTHVLKSHGPAVVPGQSPLRTPVSPGAIPAAIPAVPGAQPAGVPMPMQPVAGPPQPPSGAVIPGSAGYSMSSVNVFPAELPWPGPVLAPPPLLPQMPVLDPTDKVALAQKDGDWAKTVGTAASMYTAEAYLAVALSDRDLAWADVEVDQAEKEVDNAKKSKNPMLIQAAEAKLTMADKDLDWANAEKTASRMAQGKSMMAAATANRDRTWASIEMRAAQKALHIAHSIEQEAEEAKKEAEEQENQDDVHEANHGKMSDSVGA